MVIIDIGTSKSQFMLDITIVFMGVINQRSHHWGAPSCRSPGADGVELSGIIFVASPSPYLGTVGTDG